MDPKNDFYKQSTDALSKALELIKTLQSNNTDLQKMVDLLNQKIEILDQLLAARDQRLAGMAMAQKFSTSPPFPKNLVITRAHCSGAIS